eukprot:1364-Eustigmatos_ZCMA.PRE.1
MAVADELYSLHCRRSPAPAGKHQHGVKQQRRGQLRGLRAERYGPADDGVCRERPAVQTTPRQ